MKMITAVVQPARLEQIRERLKAAGLAGVTVSHAAGTSHVGKDAPTEIHRGQAVAPALNPKVRLDLAVRDGDVEKACDAIIQAAKEGPGGGDGMIFVQPLDAVIRLGTGDRDEAALV